MAHLYVDRLPSKTVCPNCARSSAPRSRTYVPGLTVYAVGCYYAGRFVNHGYRCVGDAGLGCHEQPVVRPRTTDYATARMGSSLGGAGADYVLGLFHRANGCTDDDPSAP